MSLAPYCLSEVSAGQCANSKQATCPNQCALPSELQATQGTSSAMHPPHPTFLPDSAHILSQQACLESMAVPMPHQGEGGAEVNTRTHALSCTLNFKGTYKLDRTRKKSAYICKFGAVEDAASWRCSCNGMQKGCTGDDCLLKGMWLESVKKAVRNQAARDSPLKSQACI